MARARRIVQADLAERNGATQRFLARVDLLESTHIALAGALGGLVHTLRSFSMYVGTR